MRCSETIALSPLCPAVLLIVHTGFLGRWFLGFSHEACVRQGGTGASGVYVCVFVCVHVCMFHCAR